MTDLNNDKTPKWEKQGTVEVDGELHEYEIIDFEDLDESFIAGHDKKGNPILRDAFGNLFNPVEEAEYHDKRAKQDATLTIRINSQILEDLKQVAKSRGEKSYQAFIRQVLYGIAMQANRP